MARPPSKQPTDGELEILKVLWETGPAGLGQIHAVLQERRGVAITTVATMLKMMLAKEMVEREDGPRGYLWTAESAARPPSRAFSASSSSTSSTARLAGSWPI